MAATEFQLLKLLEATDVRAPKVYLHDDSGEILPDPYIVIEYLEGDTNAPPTEPDEVARQMADYLVKVHAVKAPEFDLSFLSTAIGSSERPQVLDESLQEGRIRDALEAAGLSEVMNPSCLLHGDYWPGNILWDDGRLVAAVDWENVEQGDPMIDLGNTRLELLFFFGPDAMDAFTDRYRASSPVDFSALPYWDLCAALRPAGRMGNWGLDATTEKTMREGHEIFVERAFADLAKG